MKRKSLRKKRSKLTRKALSRSTSAKRRYKVLLSQIPIQSRWIDWFAERGNIAAVKKQRKHVDQLYKRKSRLEVYLARKNLL